MFLFFASGQWLVYLWEILWYTLAGFGGLAILLVASGHVILNKRETSAAIGWIGVMWLQPLLGPILYLFFGINRIRRKAFRASPEAITPTINLPHTGSACSVEQMRGLIPPEKLHLLDLAEFANNIISRPLLEGNAIKPLICGDEAYPRMLEAIEGAQKTITLTTYIFANDQTGEKFLDALAAAVQRGVHVRVLIDAVGARYSFPSILRKMRRRKIPCARFMPSLVPWRMPYLNLRSHRKILVVDGLQAFTGGMNIASGNVHRLKPAHLISDIHFHVEGPLVTSLQDVFSDDWYFVTREKLSGPEWFPEPTHRGNTLARGITDGPDENYDSLRMLLLGAIGIAKHSIRIATPYFLPDRTLISALNTAVMRGVRVDILIPDQNNLTFVDWACQSNIQDLVQWGCRVWRSAPPFDHSKLMLIDDYWSLIGSANWDPRSLNLNFEFNVECYDSQLARKLGEIFEDKRATAEMVTIRSVLDRPLVLRLRNGLARLFSPYL
ncbi:MAG: cardiolipin synthase [Opitutales bacterium]|nr:cardiolipin synthase [Opitutales bacterium]